MNSFKYGCVVTGKWYCRRPFLERELMRMLAAGQNVVVQGERRMGKTSLVQETVRGMRGWKLVYVDLLNVRSVGDVCKRVLSGIHASAKDESLFRKALRLLPMLRPVMNIDPITGGVGYSLDLRASQDPNAIEEVVNLLAEQAKRGKTVIVFDEFQDVLNIPDAQTLLAVMRGRIQFQPDVPYVFTGSVRNAMVDLFDNPDSPFYKSALTLCVGEIARESFRPFLRERFRMAGRSVTDATLEAALAEANDIPGDVQELCEALCDATDGRTSVVMDDLPSALEIVYAREGDKFESFTARLTPIQFKMLVAIACRGGRNVQSVAFLADAGIGNAATARRALSRLEDLRHIYCYRGEWRFNSTFFRSWLRRYS